VVEKNQTKILGVLVFFDDFFVSGYQCRQWPLFFYFASPSLWGTAVRALL
jgi:hypothetical protein